MIIRLICMIFFSFSMYSIDLLFLQEITGLSVEEIKTAIAMWSEHSKLEYKVWNHYYHVMPNLIEKYNLKCGCEIGVATGNHSYRILEVTNVDKLYSIDPYLSYGDPTNPKLHSKPQVVHDILYYMVLDKLSYFGKRSELIRLKSAEASSKFENESLDFIFLDANHTYESVLEDLTVWYDKVKKGGIFAGDDYCTVHPGVPRAVKKFFGSKSLKIHQDKIAPQVWWVKKP